MISIIVASAKKGVIGKTGGLPWHLPAELAYFKKITTGHPIIMGRVTHESIGRPLPNRRNIIITTQTEYRAEGCEVVGSLEQALDLVRNEPQIFVIGGESIYEIALPLAERIYLTKVDAAIDGDKHFVFDSTSWEEVSSEPHKADERNPYNYDFTVLEKKPK